MRKRMGNENNKIENVNENGEPFKYNNPYIR